MRTEHNVRLPELQSISNETLIDGIDITSDEFYKRLKASDYIPTTSALTWSEIENTLKLMLGYGCYSLSDFV